MVQKKSRPGFVYISTRAVTAHSVYVVVGKMFEGGGGWREAVFFLDDVVLAGEMTGIEEGNGSFERWCDLGVLENLLG